MKKGKENIIKENHEDLLKNSRKNQGNQDPKIDFIVKIMLG